MSKRYAGGCHCGNVRFTVEVDEHVARECNCSVCFKKGFIHVIVPKEKFTYHGPADALTTYTFNTHVAKHTFCRICGVQPFYIPRSHPNGVSANLRCFDGDAFDDFDVQPFDGRNWEKSVGQIR